MGGKKQTISSQNFRDLAKEFKIDLNEEFLD
jgi:rhamnulose-1-phosphate aldolase